MNNKIRREQASPEPRTVRENLNALTARTDRQEEAGSIGAFALPTSRRVVLKTGLGLAVVATGIGSVIELRQGSAAFAAPPPPPPPPKPKPTPTPVTTTPNAAIQWNNAALQAIRDVSPGPTIGSRALAIMHTCMYDAWAAYDPKALPTRPNGIPRQKTPPDVTQAVSYAAYRALMDLFPSDAAVYNSLMQSLGFDPSNTTTDTTRESRRSGRSRRESHSPGAPPGLR